MASLSDSEKVKRYKIFDNTFQKINKECITPPKAGDECKNMFTDFLPAFKNRLCEIEPFLKHYKLDTFQGSSYEGLSVGKYKEYDIDVHIKLDSNVVKPNGIQMSDQPGFVTLKMEIGENHAKNIADRVKVYKQWTDSENYLIIPKFLRWGESVMTKTLNSSSTLATDKFSFGMKLKKSGPALTLHVVETKSRIEFDVDIVFVLSFDSWSLGDWNGQSWVAVAKMPKGAKDTERSWRYSFPKLEKDILSGHNHLKNVIRFIKQVRDNNNMPYIASYFIKTLFMWEVKETDKQFWNKSLGYLFVIMLYKFKDAMEKKRIDFYFDKKCNLLDRCSEAQIKDAEIKITNVIKKIEKICDANTPEEIEKMIIIPNQ